MQCSVSIAAISAALVVAQQAMMAGVLKNSSNASFGTQYANLGAVIEACRKPLLDSGIVVLQSPTQHSDDAFVSVTTRLIHNSGEWIEDTCTAPATYMDAQGYGSVISYLRRYALMSMLGMYQADDDDDGNGASAGNPARALSMQDADNGAGKSPQSQKTPRKDAGVMTPDIRKRVDAWRKTIDKADASRLEAARDTVRSTFSGDAQIELLAYITARENALKAVQTAA